LQFQFQNNFNNYTLLQPIQSMHSCICQLITNGTSWHRQQP